MYAVMIETLEGESSTVYTTTNPLRAWLYARSVGAMFHAHVIRIS